MKPTFLLMVITIQHISTNGKSENIEEIFSESALQSFKEFGEKLFQILTD